MYHTATALSYFSKMLNKHYEGDISLDFPAFEFVSMDTKSSVTKVVRYSENNDKGFYSLGFADKYPGAVVIAMGSN